MSIDQSIPEQRVPDVVRATLRGRLLLVALILVAAGLVAAFQFFGLPFLKAAVSATSSANAIATIKAVLIGMMAVLVCAGAYVIWYGRKISRHGQFPLPNAWVLRDMPIKQVIATGR
jgi:nitrate reductase gamma subunit